MEVILREHVDNLGRRGEVVKVADGYARNYLLPRKLALMATEGNKKQIERERAKFDAKEARRAEGRRGRLGPSRERRRDDRAQGRRDRSALRIGHRVAPDIADALKAKGVEIDKRKLQLHEPIKKLGEFDVPLKLHRDVTTHVKVKVVAERATA